MENNCPKKGKSHYGCGMCTPFDRTDKEVSPTQNHWQEEFDEIKRMVSWCPDCLTYGTPFGLKDRVCGNCGKTNLEQFVGLNEAKYFIQSLLEHEREEVIESIKKIPGFYLTTDEKNDVYNLECVTKRSVLILLNREMLEAQQRNDTK